MPALNDLKHAMVKAAKDAEAIHENTEMSSAEKLEAMEKADVDIKALSDQIATEKSLVEQRARFAGLVAENSTETTDSGEPRNYAAGAAEVWQREASDYKSPGQTLIEHEGFKSLVNTLKVSQSSKVNSGPVEVKTTLTEGVGGTGSSGTSGSAGRLITPDYRPSILPLLFQPTTVASLMPSGTVQGNTLRYPVETTATNAASSVSEGGTKPEAALAFATVDEPVRKIAVVLKVTDEMLEDYSAIRSWVDGRLMLFVTIHEELQLLSGNGTAPDLTGLLNRSGLTAAQALGGDTRPDAIFKEITKIRIASYLEPDGIVLHPDDWQDIRLSKDSASQYYGGGPFTGQYGNGGLEPLGGTNAGQTLWGKRVVSTQNITTGTALVGAFGTAAQVFRRGGMTLEATNSDGTDFLKNLVTIRCEERLALAVYRPAAFGTVTGL